MRKADPLDQLAPLEMMAPLDPLAIQDEMETLVDLALLVFPAHPDLAAKI